VAITPSRRLFLTVLSVATAGLLVSVLGVALRAKAQSKKEFSVSAHKYSYKVEGAEKPEIRVQEGDLVRITFSSDDIPHSFTIVDDDHYRIMRRAEPGKPVPFEFLADKAGTFTFQCTLRSDDRCKELSGTLFVAARK
jgi:heme/copper-type cytochrome/quinol oxidase subunit 2